MKMTANVKKILSNYGTDNPGVKANLCRILMQGALGGTGRLVILPVDQGLNTARTVFRAERGGVRPALSFRAGD